MTIRRVFAQAPENKTVVLTGDEHHYVSRVMRLQPGEAVEVISPAGCYLGSLISIDKKSCVIGQLEPLGIINEPSLKITLFQGLPDHFDKFEWVAQKSVELGVSAIVPFVSDFTDSKYKKMDMDKKFSRIEKIMKEAVRQCKRTSVPELKSMVKLTDTFRLLENMDASFIFAEKPSQIQNRFDDKKSIENVGIFVGPEGGFSNSEFALFQEQKVQFIHLGNRILRTETASITALSMIQMKFGDYKNCFNQIFFD